MKLMKTIRKLCTPAYVYLVISIIAIVAMMIQNGGNHDRFCLGNYECGVESTAAVFLGQGLYSIFWVFVLNCICKAGYKNISWYLVLLPYILMFIILGMFILEGKKEGLENSPSQTNSSTLNAPKWGIHDGKCMKIWPSTCPPPGAQPPGGWYDFKPAPKNQYTGHGVCKTALKARTQDKADTSSGGDS